MGAWFSQKATTVSRGVPGSELVTITLYATSTTTQPRPEMLAVVYICENMVDGEGDGFGPTLSKRKRDYSGSESEGTTDNKVRRLCGERQLLANGDDDQLQTIVATRVANPSTDGNNDGLSCGGCGAHDGV